jgi:hypothetical protein
MPNKWARILNNIEQCLEMRYVECDYLLCGYKGGMAFTKTDKSTYRKCIECGIGHAHVREKPEEDE